MDNIAEATHYLYNGHALFREGKHKEALAKYKYAISLNPNISQAYNSWGAILHENGQYTEAEIKFRKAITLNPKFTGAYRNLVSNMRKQGRYQEAKKFEKYCPPKCNVM